MIEITQKQAIEYRDSWEKIAEKLEMIDEIVSDDKSHSAIDAVRKIWMIIHERK